jgi:hypothetical protein
MGPRTFACITMAVAAAMALWTSPPVWLTKLNANGPQSTAASDDFGGPLTYSYDIVDGRVIVHAKGNIALAEAHAFNAWKDTLPDGVLRRGALLISLNSPGGSIAGALDFAKWIKDNKVDTVVANGATCASACALIWGAGWNKKAGVEAHIGVHGASNIDRNATDEQRGAAEADGTLTMARTLADEGAPTSIIAATLPNEMHWLTTAEVAAWGATILDKNGQPSSPQSDPIPKRGPPTW